MYADPETNDLAAFDPLQACGNRSAAISELLHNVAAEGYLFPEKMLAAVLTAPHSWFLPIDYKTIIDAIEITCKQAKDNAAILSVIERSPRAREQADVLQKKSIEWIKQLTTLKIQQGNWAPQR